ncbi:MAG: GNAT family N-acetyltransferase, partial [Coprococcus sp.]
KILLDEKIIGAFFLIPQGEDTMQFEDFVIHPDYQGKGYGYYVLQLVEKQYSSIKEWHLSTPVFSVGNQHLYEKFGYVEVSRDEEEIRYCKRLV